MVLAELYIIYYTVHVCWRVRKRSQGALSMILSCCIASLCLFLLSPTPFSGVVLAPRPVLVSVVPGPAGG